MQEPIYQPKSPSPIVMCSQCGAAIHRDQAAPIVAQAQVGEIVDMSRRWRCRDRERCDARGQVAQTVEQLRADLEAAEIVITSLKAKVESLRVERDALTSQAQALFGAADIATRGDLKQIKRIEELEAQRALMIEDLHAWLGEQIRAIDAVCTSDEMRRRLEDAQSCLSSGSEWIR